MPEFMIEPDGCEKQDGERNAAVATLNQPGRREKSTNFALKSRAEMDLALPSRDRGP
jgi:hypothetical protein